MGIDDMRWVAARASCALSVAKPCWARGDGAAIVEGLSSIVTGLPSLPSAPPYRWPCPWSCVRVAHALPQLAAWSCPDHHHA